MGYSIQSGNRRHFFASDRPLGDAHSRNQNTAAVDPQIIRQTKVHMRPTNLLANPPRSIIRCVDATILPECQRLASTTSPASKNKGRTERSRCEPHPRQIRGPCSQEYTCDFLAHGATLPRHKIRPTTYTVSISVEPVHDGNPAIKLWQHTTLLHFGTQRVLCASLSCNDRRWRVLRKH